MKQSGGITPREEQRRRKTMERAQRLVESEGLKIPTEALALGERYIVGEITLEEALESTKAHAETNRVR